MAEKALYVCILRLILLWYYIVSHVVTYNLKAVSCDVKDGLLAFKTAPFA